MGGRTILVGIPSDTDGPSPSITPRDLRAFALGVVTGILLILALLTAV